MSPVEKWVIIMPASVINKLHLQLEHTQARFMLVEDFWPNIVSVLKDYSCPNVVNGTFSAPEILRKGVQKAGKKPKTGVNLPRPQQAIDQGILDDDEELTPVKDVDE